jgi:DNA-binding transcriptional LysR family regulator
MSPSALSHAVAAVEARLGIRLFNCTTRSVSLTEAGEQLISRVAPALADIRSAVEQVNMHRETPIGTLRINAAVGAARPFMPTVLDYLSRYPEMKVDITTEGRLVDIVAGGFDAGLRLAEFCCRT